MQMSPRACSSVTGHALSELFSLQLDFDLGLPHTEAIHSSSMLQRSYYTGEEGPRTQPYLYNKLTLPNSSSNF